MVRTNRLMRSKIAKSKCGRDRRVEPDAPIAIVSATDSPRGEHHGKCCGRENMLRVDVGRYCNSARWRVKVVETLQALATVVP